MKLDATNIPYGISDFRRIRNEGYYYVDKTAYLATVELAGSFIFFVRPRRFGKSLFISMMRYYYDINAKDNFEEYFGDLAIAKAPTPNRNKYLMLLLDFSKVEGMGGRTVEERFANYMDAALIDFINRYRAILPPEMFQNVPRESKYRVVIDAAKDKGLPLYLIIDEYDNFTNSLIRSAGNDPYRIITHGTGFYRAWFKLFKGDFDRIFMTGVSPVTMDDLTSGFNIAKNISQDARFNSMLGFSESEVLQIYRDFKGAGEFTEGDPEAIVKSIKPWYDGYCFAKEKIGRESVFNSDMVLYHLHSMVFHGLPPENMVDVNISTDYDKLETIVDLQRQMGAENVEDVSPITEELAAKGEIPFELVESFPADRLIEPDNFRSLFLYYGVLSMTSRKKGLSYFRVPNVCVEKQIFNYLRDSYRRVKVPDWIGWLKLASGFAYDGAWEPFLRRLAADFADTTPVRGGIDGEIRLQGYMQAEFGHITYYLARPEMELARGYCDFCLFPERVYNGDVRHSYIVELKYSKPDATEAELAVKSEEGIAQLHHYAADPFVPALTKDTELHLILYHFRGKEIFRLEELKD
ncbi:MAG: ATP-binding protein [Kiritimatiellae bacterium]|nr:ATP-binding protein [Kiritimatiellia bacterium]